MSSIKYSDEIQKWFGWGDGVFDFFRESNVVEGFCSNKRRLTGCCSRKRCGGGDDNGASESRG